MSKQQTQDDNSPEKTGAGSHLATSESWQPGGMTRYCNDMVPRPKPNDLSMS